MRLDKRALLYLLFAGIGLVLLAVACSSRPMPEVPPPMAELTGTAYEAAAAKELPKVPPQDEHGLHNVYRLSPDIVSGSEPHGEEAFEELKKMGVHTILSVDGKVPDEALAAKYGMTYVHVPIQYKGITQEELTQIAKTFREKEGPFYVHCFHGKHRGPAAAAVGRVVLDGASREQAIAEMRQWCGTSPNYEGLYKVLAVGSLPTAEQTTAYAWNFPSASPLEGLASGMIEVSRADDHLKALMKREWRMDPDHPDVDALNEAQKVASALERCAALEESKGFPADFQQWMMDAVTASAALRSSVADLREGKAQVEAVNANYQAMDKACTSCHKAYRN